MNVKQEVSHYVVVVVGQSEHFVVFLKIYCKEASCEV